MSTFKVNQKFDFSFQNDVKIDVSDLGNHKFHILKDNNSYFVELVSRDDEKNTFQVKVNDKLYVVDQKTSLDLLLSKMGLDTASLNKVNDLKAPMPGLVVSIKVNVGDEVKKGDALLVLEAMKMENVLKSPTDAIIKSIEVSKGNNVDKNAVLFTFE